MKRLFVLSVSVLVAQGCALRTGFTEGVIQVASATRPNVTDIVHASGDGVSRPAFGRTLPGVPTTNLPLPKTAIPGEYFRVPELNGKAKEAVFSSADVAVEAACTLFSAMYGSTDPECHRRRLYDRVPGIPNRPTVNR